MDDNEINEMKAMMDEDEEIFKPIEGFEDYEISTRGRVRSSRTTHCKILKPKLDSCGYLSYCLISDDGSKKTRRLHRLLAEAFITNIKNLECIDHIDRNKTNNQLKNLRWVSCSQNSYNLSIYKNNSSGVSGVGYYRAGWRAQWRENGQEKTKYFKTKEEAIEFRNKMVETHYIIDKSPTIA